MNLKIRKERDMKERKEKKRKRGIKERKKERQLITKDSI